MAAPAEPAVPAPWKMAMLSSRRSQRLALPLHNNPADPRLVRNAAGDEVLDTYTVDGNVAAANELARHIVTAVNHHDRLVALAAQVLDEGTGGAGAAELRLLLAEMFAPVEAAHG